MAEGPEMGVPADGAQAGHDLLAIAGHAGHDPVAIAGLLDGDAAASDRALAEVLVVTCAECAALHADLLILSSATRALPMPPRRRDFRLTAADATRLSTGPRAEPDTWSARLGGVMSDTFGHAGHDTLLVASLADHSPAGPERERATTLVDSCSLCASLHEDLVALSSATRAMPTPPRPRAYTLRPSDAVRLRPGVWRRFIAGIGTARDGFSRPLAVGLSTLGLAGLLVATVPSILTGSAGAAPAANSRQDATGAQAPTGAVPVAGAQAATGAQAPTGAVPVAGAQATTDGSSPTDASKGLVDLPAPLVMGAAVASSTPDAVSGVAGASPAPGAEASGMPSMPFRSPDHGVSTRIGEAGNGDSADIASKASTADDRGGLSTKILVPGTMLLVGLGLFAFRWRARHLGDD